MKTVLKLISEMDNRNDNDKSYQEIKNKILAMSDNDISYADIAEFTFDINDGDFEYIMNNLSILISVSEHDTKDADNKLKNILNKIRNHIKLETCRLKYLQKKQDIEIKKILSSNSKGFQTMDDKIKTYDTKIKKYETKIDDTSEEIKGWYSNIITVLGLFSAIVVTFFGGLSAVSSIFTKIDAVSKYRLIFMLLIVVFAMFNIIFMLLYYISILVNKPINRECTYRCKNSNSYDISRNNCKDKKVRCIFKRYPIIAYFNTALFIMMASLVIIYSGIFHKLMFKLFAA